MHTLEHFEQIADRGFYRPIAQVTYERAVDMVAEAMVYAREHGCVDLLVSVHGLTGFPPPSIFARHALAVKWAEAVAGKLRVAMVAPSALIDPEKIGMLMAQNRGVSGDVFTTEVAAIAWLNSRATNH